MMTQFNVGYFSVIEDLSRDGSYDITLRDSRTGESLTLESISLIEYDRALDMLTLNLSIGCIDAIAQTFGDTSGGLKNVA